MFIRVGGAEDEDRRNTDLKSGHKSFQLGCMEYILINFTLVSYLLESPSRSDPSSSIDEAD
jgi:hypothetical protein